MGCNEQDKTRPTPPAAPSAIASVLGVDAGLGVLIDPERPAGDLNADLAAFTTVEACMKQRTASLDPLVGDAVDAIGYDTFLRDACRVLEAAKTRDPKRCELIDASALRARCRAVTAMVAGDAEGCPLRAPSKPELGRDAACVAAALRSVAMCAGAERRSRPACAALVTGDSKRCDEISLEDQRTPCIRDAARFRNALSGPAVLTTLPVAKGTLTIHGETQPDPAETKVDLDLDVGSGVVVAKEASRLRVAFGHFEASTPRASQPLGHARFALAIAWASDKALVLESTLTVPGAPQGSCSGDGCHALDVKVQKLEPKRGGAYALVVDGVLGSYRVHADITTFVRDVVDR